MKVTPRFIVRAALVATAAGVIGAFGACKDGAGPPPPPPVPPPPPTIAAPSGLTATAASDTRIDLAWTDNSTNETGFKVERCSGLDCTTFAQIGASTAADVKVFADTFGLAAATSYSYRVSAFNATATSAVSTTATAVTSSPPVQGAVMIGAGEITSCASPGAAQTATLVQNQLTADPTTIVFTVGNNVSAGTGGKSYATCFDPNWGKFKDKTFWAAVGTGDYESVGEEGIYSYFGNKVGAPNGWYSFEVGSSWHVVVLNTSSWQWGTCNMTGASSNPECVGKPTPMLDWLAQDLAANTKPCLMALSWERRLYTTGNPNPGRLGRNSNMNTITQMLVSHGLDVLVSANDKQYERFPKTNVDGVADPAGFAQFIVGTGGRSLDRFHAPVAENPVAAQFGGQGNEVPDSWGVVKFTLNASSYKWEWVGTTAAFTDSGEQACN